jgi:hypothetical protein
MSHYKETLCDSQFVDAETNTGYTFVLLVHVSASNTKEGQDFAVTTLDSQHGFEIKIKALLITGNGVYVEDPSFSRQSLRLRVTPRKIF